VLISSLISGEKRLALLAEIQKLKSANKEEKKEIQPCFGSLTIENLQLPLRTEYIFSMASKKDGGIILLVVVVMLCPTPYERW